ncbi:MAG: hypothetical protein B7X41_09835 [Microbacterium sp. 14-71-5]|jgi:hypothetical protein|uniref:hypothetical protein n=1 Tax=Microbacterium sp. 13-71-7 TaxID=1970399 RepID=UPI000BC7C82E|nr:hypothetical protein [Microbacterium sp. 13-71-7]OZB88119.1 MAG: hypothetical protein B7X41_09835 [Microbacterium sp. 14-71-5]
MTRIAVDPEHLRGIDRLVSADAELARAAVQSMPASVDGGEGSDAIADVIVRMGMWIGALGQVDAALGAIVRDIADGVMADEERTAEELNKVAQALEDAAS